MYYNKHNWVNTTEILAVSFEYLFTKELFKNDLSRAIYATSDYAYRRRFELLDTSRDFENIDASSLQFPFMSYHVDDNWSPITEKRIFKLEEFGYSGASLLGNLRIIQVKNKVKTLLHFNREDEARLAYDKLAFMSSNKRWVTQTATYQFDTLEVPVKMVIDASSISFSPKVQEMDWLKQNRLFVLSFDVDVESMIFYPPVQGETEYDPEPFILSEEVVAEFLAGKDTQETSVNGVLSDNSITLNSFVVERSTKTTARIGWDILDQNTLDKLTLEVNGKTYDIALDDYNKVIRGLLSGAEYHADLYAIRGDYSKHFSLTFTTVSGVTTSNDIVGTTW